MRLERVLKPTEQTDKGIAQVRYLGDIPPHVEPQAKSTDKTLRLYPASIARNDIKVTAEMYNTNGTEPTSSNCSTNCLPGVAQVTELDAPEYQPRTQALSTR